MEAAFLTLLITPVFGRGIKIILMSENGEYCEIMKVY